MHHFHETFSVTILRFDLKKGQPELLLREVLRGQNKHQRQNALVARFQVQLLSVIQRNSDKYVPLIHTNNESIHYCFLASTSEISVK